LRFKQLSLFFKCSYAAKATAHAAGSGVLSTDLMSRAGSKHSGRWAMFCKCTYTCFAKILWTILRAKMLMSKTQKDCNLVAY